MDYKIVHLDDVKDVLGDYPGEMRMMKCELETEQVAITYRRMPAKTGSKGSYGHWHKEIEEVTFIVAGKLQVKLGEEIVELKKHDVIKISPETVRGFWNEGPEEVELLIISKRISHDDSEKVEDFWSEEKNGKI